MISSCVSVCFHPHRGGSGTVRIGQLPRMQPRSRVELIKGDQLSPRLQTVFRNADAVTLQGCHFVMSKDREGGSSYIALGASESGHSFVFETLTSLVQIMMCS